MEQYSLLCQDGLAYDGPQCCVCIYTLPSIWNVLAASPSTRATVSIRWNNLAPSARVPVPMGMASQREAHAIFCNPAVQEMLINT